VNILHRCMDSQDCTCFKSDLIIGNIYFSSRSFKLISMCWKGPLRRHTGAKASMRSSRCWSGYSGAAAWSRSLSQSYKYF
jgi:hypothetical protein